MKRRVAVIVSGVLLSSLVLTGCIFGLATVGGSVTGLPAGTSVVLQNNGADNLTLTENGRFTFKGTLDADEDYNVTVLTQPAGANCTPSNNTGKIDSRGRDVDNVLITCAVSGNLTGTLSGLPAGNFITVLNNGGSALQVFANGSFTFPGTLANNANYVVTVQTPLPSGLTTCTVTGGSGQIVSGVPNTTITIACS